MTISLAAVFIPLVFMTGLVGRIFREFSDHHHRFDFRQRHRFADADAADVLAPAGPARRGRQEDLDGARDRRHRAPRAGRLRADAVVFPAPALDFGVDLGGLPGWARSICSMSVPKAFLPVGDSSFIRGVFVAQEGSSPDQMHAYQEQVGGGACTPIPPWT